MGQRPPSDGSPQARQEWANGVMRDYYSRGATRTGPALVWGGAIFGSLLTITSTMPVIPPIAHAWLHDPVKPSALLGTLFFGVIAFVAIRQLLRVHRAKRYLREHPEQ